MICDAVIIHCDDYFDMMLKSAAIDSGSWERFITNKTKQGEWERIPYSFAGGFRCSCCGTKTLEKYWNFCPNCGADMRGEK